MSEVRHFHTKVVGVTHPNRDGSDRQGILARCASMEDLELCPEPENPVDANAVAVCRANGEQLGYLSRELAREVSRRESEGWNYKAMLMEVTGGDDKWLGANILIICAPPEASSEPPAPPPFVPPTAAQIQASCQSAPWAGPELEDTAEPTIWNWGDMPGLSARTCRRGASAKTENDLTGLLVMLISGGIAIFVILLLLLAFL